LSTTNISERKERVYIQRAWTRRKMIEGGDSREYTSFRRTLPPGRHPAGFWVRLFCRAVYSLDDDDSGAPLFLFFSSSFFYSLVSSFWFFLFGPTDRLIDCILLLVLFFVYILFLFFLLFLVLTWLDSGGGVLLTI